MTKKSGVRSSEAVNFEQKEWCCASWVSQELMGSNWRSVMIANSLDIAAMNEGNHISEHKRSVQEASGWLPWKEYYSSNLRANILGTARSAVYICLLTYQNLLCMSIALKSFAKAVKLQFSSKEERDARTLMPRREPSSSTHENITNEWWKELCRMIHLKNSARREIVVGHLSIWQRLLSWGMPKRITQYQFCFFSQGGERDWGWVEGKITIPPGRGIY